MGSERWQQVTEIFHAALASDPARREAFLTDACGGDAALRAEVEALVAAHHEAGPFGETPLFVPALSLEPGSSIGSYRIEELLGAGGMGEVYRARDGTLERDVAIKVLPQHLASDPERVARLLREARLLAALNHPNIAAIYGVVEADAHRGLVLEFVEGPTLADRLAAGPLLLDDTLRIAHQIAEALEGAHEKGVTHRDLKPANVKITPDGMVKVLDFGLAKALRDDASASERSGSTVVRTMEGMLLGTAAYMSPEQARGRRVDKRTDIWAFGCVFYEMLTGHPAFDADTVSDTLVKILEREPDWSLLPEAVPDAIRKLLRRCLSKDPAARLHDIGDARLDIAETIELRRAQRLLPTESVPVVSRQPQQIIPAASSAASSARASARLESKPGRRARGVVAGSLAITLLLLTVGALRRLWERDYFWQNPLANAKVERLTDFEGTEADAVISPDGKLAAFYADRDGQFDVWITQIGSGEFINITKGRLPGESNLGANPRFGFSPDGTQVWITRQPRPQFFVTWLMPALGGTPHLFLEPGMNPAWSPDGAKVAYFTADPGDPIFIAERDGTNRRQIFREKPGWHCHFVIWSPDGRFIYFTRGLVVTDEFDIWRIPVAESTGGAARAPERITYHNGRVGYLSWVDSRTLIYSAPADDGSGQWLYAIDVEHRIPHRVSSGIAERYLSVAVSETTSKRLVATVATPTVSLWRAPLSDRVETDATVERFTVPNKRALAPRFAADYLLFLSSKGGGDGLWKLANGSATELWRSSDGGIVAPPAISPDGTQIGFSARRHGRARLYVMSANGTNIRPLAESLDVRGAATWSPDGKWMAVAGNQGEGTRIFKVPVDGGPPVRLLATTSYNPLWSPDGRLIIYSESLQGGASPIKAMTPDGAPVQLPDVRVNYNGSPFRFMPNGKGLVFIKERATVGGANFYWVDLETGRERQLTDLKQGYRIASFDLSPDGTHIVFDRLQENADVVLMDLAR